MTLLSRIWAKITIPTGDVRRHCWGWSGAVSTKRRGRRHPVIHAGDHRGRQIISVAREICQQKNGPPPTPQHEAGHTCPHGEWDICVSPFHLQWMTRVENEHHKRR